VVHGFETFSIMGQCISVVLLCLSECQITTLLIRSALCAVHKHLKTKYVDVPSGRF
jgi:hypothetical protein